MIRNSITVFVSACLAASSTSWAAAQSFSSGDAIEASPTWSDAGWTACTYVRGPAADNNGAYLVTCNGSTMWVGAKWVRAAKAAPSPAPQPQAPNSTAASVTTAGGGCFASSAPAGLSGRGQAFAAVLLRHWTIPADPGSDGATTAQLQALQIGASHPATFSDLRQYAVAPGGAVYPLRIKFTLCKDYRTSSHYHAAEENAVCFAAAAGGGAECSLTGHTAGLANPRDWDVRK